MLPLARAELSGGVVGAARASIRGFWGSPFKVRRLITRQVAVYREEAPDFFKKIPLRVVVLCPYLAKSFRVPRSARSHPGKIGKCCRYFTTINRPETVNMVSTIKYLGTCIFIISNT